jgi:hypothetical protein
LRKCYFLTEKLGIKFIPDPDCPDSDKKKKRFIPDPDPNPAKSSGSGSTTLYFLSLMHNTVGFEMLMACS